VRGSRSHAHGALQCTMTGGGRAPLSHLLSHQAWRSMLQEATTCAGCHSPPRPLGAGPLMRSSTGAAQDTDRCCAASAAGHMQRPLMHPTPSNCLACAGITCGARCCCLGINLAYHPPVQLIPAELQQHPAPSCSRCTSQLTRHAWPGLPQV
jgi:hypothetical protein